MTPTRAPLHLADSPPPDKLYVTTYCGRLLSEVMWATPELAEDPHGFLPTKPRCGTCTRSLARRRRGSASTARQKIREAAERHGLTVAAMEWTPVGQMIEMQGREGGWYVEIEGYGIATGYSWQDVVEQIDRCAPMWLDGSLVG